MSSYKKQSWDSPPSYSHPPLSLFYSSPMSSFTDQAQSAVQSSSLAEKVPLDYHPAGPGVQNTNTAGSPGSTTPRERLTAASKDAVINYDKIAKNTEAISKELCIWGQTKADDLKDGGCIFLRRGPQAFF